MKFKIVSERKRVLEQQALFTSIVNTSNDGIISKTLDGIITTWNKGAEDILGYTADEIVGKHIAMLIPPHRQHEESIIVEKIRQGEFIHHYETERIRKDGQVVSVSLTISALKNAEGKIIGASKILRDVTERNKNQEQLKKYAQELERSNKELEQFAYIASHDLQEPLRMVGSYLQLIERKYKGKLDADADEFIHLAVDGATRMKQLINDLLNYSRIHREGKPSPVDIAEVLNEMKQGLAAAIQESGAIVNFSGMPVIEAYRTQMVQLFQNLIGNAIKFRREGISPVITILAQQQNHDWLFSVSDNGIGIDTQYADTIFVIFKKLHTRAKYGGTGIGLAVVKKIVERHGGKIWFESEPEKGTTFYFTLNAKL